MVTVAHADGLSIARTFSYMIRFVMRFAGRTITLLSFALLAACGSDSPTACCHGPLNASVRVVNAFTAPIDVLIDGSVAVAGAPAGSVSLSAAEVGTHTVMLRPTTGASVSQSITTSAGALNTIAVVRASSGALATLTLDDTNSVVPSGATKVRVLHLAPNAGVLQVYRTQPDYQQPIDWQFPFTYQSQIDALSAPFFQSTVGSWDIRVWQTPADASGWANAPARVVIPLNSGEKKTVLILDKPGGGVILQLI
jgi:hypothetical protein